MPNFNSLKDIEKFLNKKIADSLNKEVATAVKQTEQEVIEEVVYDAYEPVIYQRRGWNGGGLGDMRNMSHKVVSGWHKATSSILEVANLTTQNDKYVHGDWGSPYIADFIETGTGYDYWGNPFPRPFTRKTIERLGKSDILDKAMQQGLKRNGIDTN